MSQCSGDGHSNRMLEDQTKAILGKHLDGDFRVFPMAETGIFPGQIEAIADKCRIHYPDEYVAHVCGRFPGVYVEVVEEIWPRPKACDVGPFWSFLYALHTFTPATKSEGWMRLDVAAESFQKETGLVAAPVLKIVGNADVYCVDASGRLAQFDHETNRLQAVPLNFWQLFEREIAELRDRKDRRKQGA